VVDVFTPAERSRVMSRVRDKNTKPELMVRSLLHRLGFRFRLHRADLPGKPDIVLPRHHSVVFVHGCFWHQHRGCKAAVRPSSRREYWDAKLDGNVNRDRRDKAHLHRLGWRVLVVWECHTKSENRLRAKLLTFLKT